MEKTFHALAPHSDICTPSSRKLCYDVFINHRGKDVKHRLASNIYNMLVRLGVQAFLDEQELELGESFPRESEEAMRSASVHIAIFSSHYAESPWCLEELSLMLQMNVTIIPVFYGVDPTDLRYVAKAKGKYAAAFDQHRAKGRYDSEKIEEWEKALSRVSWLSGSIVNADKCDEGKLLGEIVDTALQKMKKAPLQIAMFPVGLDEAVQDFESEIESTTSSENVQIVGIVGMGGSGKTTLAKELYNRKCSTISRSSFLSNVRDAASTNTLHNLQEKLLKDLRIQHPPFGNKEEGMGMLARYLRYLNVLIVLDNVDHMDQIEALLPRQIMFNLGGGSFIIVTTREVDVLTATGISSIYHIKELSPVNSKKLFCAHASLDPFPQLVENDLNFQDLINGFLSVCKGLPLALKVFGAMVNGKNKAFWESQLGKISRILPHDIDQCFKVSYEALDPEVQQMFLDVACFFIGGEKSQVVAIWDGSKWSGEVGWETLVNKCLVGFDKDGNIDMHDLLRDLGRQIARDISPSRIWKEEQISIQEGTTPIRGIVSVTARPSQWSSGMYMTNYYRLPLKHCMENFFKKPSLRALQLLAVVGNDLREEFAASSIVWLRLWGFDGASLPSWLSLADLRVLELIETQNLKELWQDNVQPPLQLRELIIHITGNTCFQGLPRSIGDLRHLRKMILNGWDSGMKSLPEEFCHLESLEFLELSNLPELSSMPDHFGKLINLRSLYFWGVGLTALPVSFKRLTALQTLSIVDSNNFMFTSEMLDVLKFMTELQVIKISGCPQVEELPHLTAQGSLRELDMIGSGLRELPNNISRLIKLQTLKIGSDNLTSLPESLGALSCLTSLDIKGDNLTGLPESLGALSRLTSIEIGPCKMLESLDFLKFMTELQVLKISGCPQLEELPCLTTQVSLRELILWNTGLRELPNNFDQLVKLESLKIGYHNLTRLPDSFGALPCLTYLSIMGHNLTSLPESLGALTCLTSLIIGGNKLTSLPESLGALPCLTSLSIDYCQNLEFLPEVLGRLPSLQDLYINWIPIVEMSLGIGSPSGCNFKSLKSLFLTVTKVCRISISDHFCPSLERFHLLHNDYLTDIETLPGNVREIEVRNCENLKNMMGIDDLQNLEWLLVADCPDLEVGIGSPWGCNLKSLKSLSLTVTRVCRISISNDCSPGLETVSLIGNDYLTEIETLPGNVRRIEVCNCKILKNMRGIGGLLNLERLEVYDCPNLEVLPCPAYMHSEGHTKTITGCPKVGVTDGDGCFGCAISMWKMFFGHTL